MKRLIIFQLKLYLMYYYVRVWFHKQAVDSIIENMQDGWDEKSLRKHTEKLTSFMWKVCTSELKLYLLKGKYG